MRTIRYRSLRTLLQFHHWNFGDESNGRASIRRANGSTVIVDRTEDCRKCEGGGGSTPLPFSMHAWKVLSLVPEFHVCSGAHRPGREEYPRNIETQYPCLRVPHRRYRSSSSVSLQRRILLLAINRLKLST